MKKTLLALFLITKTLLAGTPFIFNGTFAKSLVPNLNLQDTSYILQGTVDPTSAAQTAPAGSLYLRSNGTLYIKQDAGSSTNWSSILFGIVPLANGGTGLSNARTSIATTGAINNQAVATSWLVYTGSASVTLSGLVAQADGTEVTISNQLTGNSGITVTHNSSSSTAANRFTNADGVAIAIRPGWALRFRYDGATSRWITASQSFSLLAPLSLSGGTISMPQATTSQSGYFSASDYTTFTKVLYWFSGAPSDAGIIPFSAIGSSNTVIGTTSDLVYKATPKLLGVSKSDPQATVHAASVTSTSLSDPLAPFAQIISSSIPPGVSSASATEAVSGVGSDYTETGITRNYLVYERIACLGGTGDAFSTSVFPYSMTDNNTGQLYYVQHSVTSSQNRFRIIGSVDGTSFDSYIDVSGGSSVDEHPSTWTSGSTVLPNDCGIVSNGTALTRSYQIVSFKSIAGTRIYSNPITANVTDPNDGQTHAVQITWQSGGGTVDGYKIIRSLDGGSSYTDAREVDSSTFFIYDDQYAVWPENTTSTPTAAYYPAGGFEAHGSSISDPPTVFVKGLDDYSRIDFLNSADLRLGYFEMSGGIMTAGVGTFNMSGSASISGLLTVGSTFTANGDVNLGNSNVSFLNASGSKIGTSTSQKFSFWNSTPIVQPANTVAINDVLVNTGLRASGGVSNFSTTVKPRTGGTAAGSEPLQFTSASLLTTATAGTEEFLTDKFYGTITTGTARKEFTLNDAALTSGRVPFATTNGRITDDSDMTFSVDTLTVTKIAATTFTGDVTLSTKNIITDTSTGTKIGTGTTQKLGFFNATPVVQQTGDVATALSNLGLVTSPTVSSNTVSGQLRATGSAPTVGSCGTSPSISGTDTAGAVTIGTGGVATSCTITFNAAWTNAPHCFANDKTEIVAVSFSSTSTTTAVLSKTTPFAASSVIDYFCVSN